MPIEKGYLIMAVGDTYLRCAHKLKQTILDWHACANVTIVTAQDLPHGDFGGQANDWQAFEVSPYRQTIKLEADMYCAGPIDHWWNLFEHRDVVISQGCRDYHDRPAQSRFYRRVFDSNHLPDVYNAITYWRMSRTAREFFDLVRDIFANWPDYRTVLRFPDDQPSTDLVYAMAAVIMGTDRVLLPSGMGPSIVHMKKHMIATRTEDWTQELIWEKQRPGLRINSVAQWGLVHYHVKDWS